MPIREQVPRPPLLVLVAMTVSACGATGLSAEPSARSPGCGSGSSAPRTAHRHRGDTDGTAASVAPYPPVVSTPTGILPPDSVARVTATGLRVRAGAPGSPQHLDVTHSLSAGDLVLIGSREEQVNWWTSGCR